MGASVRPDSTGDRISRNVAAMRAQGATEHDVEAYLTQHEGLTPEAPATSTPSATPGQQFGALVGQGASLGFGAKILGGVDAANKMLPRVLGGESAPASDFGKNYTATRDRIRGAAEEGIREHPIAGPATEMLSGVAATLPALAGQAVTKAPVLIRALRSAGAGAGIGAAAGVGNATGDVMDYARQAGIGAASGAAVGAALPPVIEAVGAGGGKLLTAAGLRPTGRAAEEIASDAVAQRAPVGAQAPQNAPAMQSVMNGAPRGPALQPSTLDRFRATTGAAVQGTGVESSKTRALREVARRFELDNVTPQDATAFFSGAGNKPLAVLDLGGGNVAGLARTAKDVPSLARRQIPEFLNTRSAGTFGNEGATLGRITGDVESRIGLKPENYYQTVDQMVNEQKALSKPAYDAVRNEVVDDPDVLSLFDIPQFKFAHRAVAEAERIRPNGAKIQPLSSTTEIGGEQVKSLNPQTLGTLDKMRQYVGEVARGKFESTKISKNTARAMLERLDAVTERMDELYPQYAEARAGYAGRAQSMEAYQAGKDEFLTADPREMAAKLTSMPESQADLYRRGAYDALRANKLTKMPDGSNIGAFLEKNPDIRDRIAVLAKDQGDAQALRGDFNVERTMGSRKESILGGPNTAERLIEHESTKPRVTQLGNVIRSVPGGKFVAPIFDNAITRRSAEQTGDVMSEVGKIMTRTGTTGLQSTFDEIAAIRARDLEREMRRRALSAAFAGGPPRGDARKRP